MELSGRRVVVVGLGLSGRAAASLCAARGAMVIGVDLRLDAPELPGVAVERGPHRSATFADADLIVVSPGVPYDQPDVVDAERRGVPVIGELGLAAELLGDVPVIGVTGTNGKSTVTSFTGQILAAAGRRAFVGGNLGDPLAGALPRDGGSPDFEIAVVECSSYQLERAGPLRPVAATILNLTPDHLARHKTMPAYAAAKARLLRHQTERDLALLPADPVLVDAARGVGRGRRATIGGEPGVWVDGSAGRIRLPGIAVDLDLAALQIPGAHNRLNALVAAALALWAGAPAEAVRESIGALRALPHRMEIVGESGGVVWINDSKATNVEAALVGVGGLSRPAVVLLGGQAKGPGFGALAPALRGQRAVLTFGASGPDIAAELLVAGVEATQVGSLADAVRCAADLAHPGDAVLLSPGCASFDAFENFEHRGREFAALVKEIRP
jgi:UDP-N-acetylmuramoylalanine--D-glutamate ligase